ncbi:MAG TPA: TRC40/GET3/ArsA family transport-energizing ATPase [Steroidobacteraceae bacterium]|nr:TRC40/GET3/ArsA family transport-energizing ATPase [Steroidobacteraceae bacterium]
MSADRTPDAVAGTLAADTRVHVFLGKGGVGKTTCAAATALALAEAGESSLVISTDPTPSLSHIFEVEGLHRDRQVLPGLCMTEFGLEDVRAMWDEKFGREVYGVFSSFVDVDYPTFVQFMSSVLPGLNEEFMVDYVRRLALDARYRNVVWDTAPLGQTLALLGMPAMLDEHLRTAPRIYSRLRTSGDRREPVLAIIGRWRRLAADCMEFLRRDVSFSMVTIPEALSVCQLDGVVRELARYGLRFDRVVVNNVVQASDSALLERRVRQQRPHLERIRAQFGHPGVVHVPWFPEEVRGLERLRAAGRCLCGTPAVAALAVP